MTTYDSAAAAVDSAVLAGAGKTWFRAPGDDLLWACSISGQSSQLSWLRYPTRPSLPPPTEDWLREVVSLVPELLAGRCVEASAGVAIVLEEMQYLILCQLGKPWLVLGQRCLTPTAPAQTYC